MPFNMGVILQMIYTAEVEENCNKGEKRMKMPLYVLVFVTTLPTTTIFSNSPPTILNSCYCYTIELFIRSGQNLLDYT